MGMTTIRIQPDSHKALKEIAAITGETMQEALARAIQDRRRRLYLEGTSADYARLAKDPKAMAEFKKEAAAWDVANLDGLKGL
jgi:hypothetical protein